MSDESDVSAADSIADVQAAMEEARRRVAEAPVEGVVTNHVMGLYELAAIHLSAEQPDLHSAALAIDAVACLVDGLGERLGPDVDQPPRRPRQHPPGLRRDQEAGVDLGVELTPSRRVTAGGSGRRGRRPPDRRGR